jgi:hypothetical protein
MRKDLLIIALGLFATAGVAGADVVTVPETNLTPEMTVPAKGTSMADVQKKFGDPHDKHGPVGGDTPKHPPITRWDYEGFVVIFEKDRVVDSVVPGAPPKLRTTSGLTPAAGAPPLPGAPPAEAAPEAEPIVPEPPASETPPPMEPAAEAAPAMPEPPPAEPSAPPAEPAPEASPSSQEIPDDAPPTPK